MIYILYRHTSNATGLTKFRPSWFSHEKSLENILSTIDKVDFCQFHLIYDGEYQSNDPRIHHIENFEGGSDLASYLYTWSYAKTLSLTSDDYIYIAENDYAFVHGWPHKLKELIDTYDDLDYVTLYDHSDKYDPLVYPNLHTYLYVTKTHHWRWVPNTTGSIIFSKRILDEDYDIHTSDPSDFKRFEFLRNNRQRNVLSPIPSLATHCEIDYLAPTIDWEKIIQNDRII